MAGYFGNISLFTECDGVHDITDMINQEVVNSKIQDGICIVYCAHTTASVTIASNVDKKGYLDLINEMKNLVPARCNFHHTVDTPTDAAGHIKTALIGVSVTLIVKNNKIVLGDSQGILFLEFDGPRDRNCYVKVISD